MKQIKISVTPQTRSDLNFLREMLEVSNIGQVIERLVESEAIKQDAIRTKTVGLMPSFACSRHPREHHRGE